MTNEVWVLPEGGNFAVEFYSEGRWLRKAQYGKEKDMKVLARTFSSMNTVRVVEVSRYDPHPPVKVVFYMEAK